MKTLYLIGGTMGVGKSTVAQRLRDTLPAAVMLDGDWCWSASPFIVTDETRTMVLDNICHVLNNFLRCSAYENVVFCWVMHEQAIIDAIRANLPLAETGCRVVNISLTSRKRHCANGWHATFPLASAQTTLSHEVLRACRFTLP